MEIKKRLIRSAIGFIIGLIVPYVMVLLFLSLWAVISFILWDFTGISEIIHFFKEEIVLRCAIFIGIVITLLVNWLGDDF